MTLTHGIDKRPQLFYLDLTMRWPDPILKPLESNTISKNIRSLEQNIEITTLTLPLQGKASDNNPVHTGCESPVLI
jgi:hypothetical protein